MRRTASRPLPAGRVRPDHARAFGFVLIGAGLAILCPLTNPLTGVLAAITVFIYLYVYTPLKRVTSFNTLVGTLPGALPALGGWTAATGRIGVGGLALFAVLVFWQMPHFLSLAWMYRKDYERAGFRMWSINDAAGNVTAGLTLAFAALTGVAGLLPGALDLSGPFYVIGAAALGVSFFAVSLLFHRTRSVKDARRVLKASIWYIPLLLTLIMVDRLL
jgi:protoheme IX farnesyltransferase